MSDTAFFKQRLAEDETALVALEKQRDALDRKIEALAIIVKIEREVVCQEEPEPGPPHTQGSAFRWGSKAGRVNSAVDKMLTEHDALHRRQIYDRLKKLGILGEDKKDLRYMGVILSRARGYYVIDRYGNWSIASKQSKEQEKMSE